MKEEKNFNLIPYQVDNGEILEVTQSGENVWLTQKSMAELFECTTYNISLHLKNIFDSEELNKNSVTDIFSVTANDSKKYFTLFYNLDAIISVGYRVNSKRGVKFRQWATQVIKNRIKQEFTKYKSKSSSFPTDKSERAIFIKQKMKDKGITQVRINRELGYTEKTIHCTIIGKHINPIINKWLKDNLLEEDEKTTKKESPLNCRANKIFNDAINGDYSAYKKLLLLFETVYNFKSSDNLGLEVVNE